MGSTPRPGPGLPPGVLRTRLPTPAAPPGLPGPDGPGRRPGGRAGRTPGGGHRRGRVGQEHAAGPGARPRERALGLVLLRRAARQPGHGHRPPGRRAGRAVPGLRRRPAAGRPGGGPGGRAQQRDRGHRPRRLRARARRRPRAGRPAGRRGARAARAGPAPHRAPGPGQPEGTAVPPRAPARRRGDGARGGGSSPSARRRPGRLLAEAGLAVEPEGVWDLHRRTEGWPTGLLLVAESGGALPEAGGDERLFEYLAQEVLALQPPRSSGSCSRRRCSSGSPPTWPRP